MCMSRGPKQEFHYTHVLVKHDPRSVFLFLAMTHKCVHAFNMHKSVDTSYTYAKSVNNKNTKQQTTTTTKQQQQEIGGRVRERGGQAMTTNKNKKQNNVCRFVRQSPPHPPRAVCLVVL